MTFFRKPNRPPARNLQQMFGARAVLTGVPVNSKDLAMAKGDTARRLLLSSLSRRSVLFARDEAINALLSAGQETLSYYWEDEEESYSADAYEVTEEGVAVIPVVGTMLDEPMDWWMGWMGCCSTPYIEAQIRHAADDANVKGVRVYFDTPGGQASGVYSAGQAFLYARSQKPVVAWCKSACSAGYWLASQCDSIEIRQDSEIGCIGSVIRLSDWSGYYEMMGVTVDRITSTGAEKYKGMGATGTVVTPEQKTEFKRIADEHQALFNEAVASGRGMELAEAQALADGRWYLGASAIALNLADRITDFDTSLAAIEAVQRRPLPAPYPPPDDGDGGETEEAKPPGETTDTTTDTTITGLPELNQEALPVSADTTPSPLMSGDDNTAHERTEETQPMTIGEQFNAWLSRLGIDLSKPAAEGDPSQAATPPVVPATVPDPQAALLASPEYQAFLAERDRVTAENERLATEQTARITSLRAEVKASAVTAYGIETDAGKRAVESAHAVADALTDEAALNGLKSHCEATATLKRTGRSTAAPAESGVTSATTFLGAESEEQYDRVTAQFRATGDPADKKIADRRETNKAAVKRSEGKGGN